MDDDPFTEEEQRFNNMLDGLVEEYDEQSIEDEKQTKRKDMLRTIGGCAIIIGSVVAFWNFLSWIMP